MDVLRTAVSMLGLYDPRPRTCTAEANERKAVKLMAKTATIVTSFDRLRNGRKSFRAIPAWSRGEFPLHSDRQEAGRRDGESLRHRADPARRSRVERIHVCGSRDGGHTVRHLLSSRSRRSAL